MSEPSQRNCTNDLESLEEEIEPKLKYMRLANDLQNIFLTTTAKCIAVHPKFICLGSFMGKIHLLDHQGNLIQDLDAHKLAVNQISIDVKGDFLATCSDEGKVFIHSLYSEDNNYEMSVTRLIKTIALEPYYYKTSMNRRFITGDDTLMLHERTFLGRLRSTVLCESEGYVRSLCWGENFIAWSSDIGVRIYDINARCSLGLIKWEEHRDGMINKFRCNLRWADSRTLLIAWVDTVRVCVIRKRSTIELANRDLPEYLVDPVSTFKTEFYISGIAPLDHQLVLLGVSKELDDNNQSMRPQLFIVEYTDNDYTDICTDCLSLRGFEKYTVNDYHLDVLIEENRFFIVAPKDIVIASPYDLDDRIQWLLQHSKFEEALVAITESSERENQKFTKETIGVAYLDYLLSKKMYDKAGKTCHKIFGRNKVLWEEEIYKFATVRQLRSVSPYIPTSIDCKLDKHIYEMVLYEYLKMDSQGFLNLIKEWDHELYNTSVVINAVLEHLMVSDADKYIYLESLALLYSYQRQYDKSLSTYLTLKNKDVFVLIEKHKLYNVIENIIVDLMKLDLNKSIKLLLDKNGPPPDVVIKKLANENKLLYEYLDAYDKIDYKKQYHGLLVKLYAIFARHKLLPLLKRSTHYPIQEAYDICEKSRFYEEMVYLLERIGDTKGALQLIIHKLKDIRNAVAFCQKQNDRDLWDDLINYSLQEPKYISYLLQSLGTHLDPTVLVQKIAENTEIPDLKNSLVKMLCTYNLQVSVNDGCKKILVSDYFNLHNKLVNIQKKGVNISDDMVCGRCHKKTLPIDVDHASSNGITIFNCKHSFHEDCLKYLPDVTYCVICHAANNLKQLNFSD